MKTLPNPGLFFLAAIIEDAVRITKGITWATEKDRCDAVVFLRGPKCKRWLEDYFVGVDHADMVREIFGEGDNGDYGLAK